MIDSESGIGLQAVLVPFASADRPVAVAICALTLYAVLTVLVTTRMRTRPGTPAWRRVHRLAFVAWAAAMGHGLLAGTDTGRLWTTALDLGAAALVGGLFAARVVRPSPAAPAPAPSSLPPLSPPAGAMGNTWP